ncbi:MAG: OmpA family protein [Sedimentisphaerales bacterium]|nr:OmpA family protein [Sedimentisphaerales bacterium]
MAKPKQKKTEGIPDYMLTYGDMMTLLFCFFVILVSMSEIKKDIVYQDVMRSIKQAFGYQGGIGTVPGHINPKNTTVTQMTQLILRKFQLQVGKSVDEGIEGQNPSVTNIREGYAYAIGGVVMFESGKSRLLSSAEPELVKFCDIIRGLTTKIRIQGHANRKSPEQYAPFKDLDDLAYARAKAVKEFMVEKGIAENRITIESCGYYEPLEAQPYDEKAKAKNRRVSIIVTENIVDDYKGQEFKGETNGL